MTIVVNGRELQVPPGTLLSAALLAVGIPCRHSVTGQPRSALCGIGVCFECRATIDGVAHRRTCQQLCKPGMVVETT